MRIIYKGSIMMLVLLVLSLDFMSCGKDHIFKRCNVKEELCDSSLLFLTNRTNATVRFNRGDWSSANEFPFRIKAGQTLVFKAKGVKITYEGCDIEWHSSFDDLTFDTNGQHNSVRMDRCTKYASFVDSGNPYFVDFKVEED